MITFFVHFKKFENHRLWKTAVVLFGAMLMISGYQVTAGYCREHDVGAR